jgi:septal ring factor EnvC (AmiA/AmiB activator)
LPVCPKCGNKVQTPTKVFSVIVEPKESERGFTERKVGMYQCTKCQTKFPTVISKQHYLVVAEEQLKQMQGDLKSFQKNNEELEKELKIVKKDYEQLQNILEKDKKESEIKRLEVKLHALEEQVTYLRKEKGKLEQKLLR